MIRTTTIKQFSNENFDLAKIHAVAGNTDLAADDVFDFGKFVIARSGRNHNRTDITSEAQRAAVDAWIGKPILYKDHETTTENQIGRIYDAWVEDQGGETVTFGRAFACKAKDGKDADIQTKIKNRIHREMSCGYEVTKSECSICGNDVTKTKGICVPHVREPGYYAKDTAFIPAHVSFTGNPAVEGAGLCTHARQDDAESVRLNMLAQDGQTFREWTSREFSKWFRLNNKSASAEEIETLTSKLSAREMVTFARLEQARFQEVIPSGAQQLTAPQETEAEPTAPKHKNIQEIFKNRSK